MATQETPLVSLEDFRGSLFTAGIESSEELAARSEPLELKTGDGGNTIDLRSAVPVATFNPTIERADDTAERAMKFTISDSSVDRHGDVVESKGWQLANYRLNPVVLWAHDRWSPPIGKAIETKIGSGALISFAEFAKHDLAETVYQLLLGGFLRATSVGFKPIKFLYNAERGGYDFAEQELLEYSVVNVPANPRALKKAHDAGINLGPVRAWSLRTLEADLGEDALVIPVSRVEALCKAMGWSHGRKLFEIPVGDLVIPAPVKSDEATPPPAALEPEVKAEAPAAAAPRTKLYAIRRGDLQKAVIAASEPFQTAVTRVTGQIFIH